MSLERFSVRSLCMLVLTGCFSSMFFVMIFFYMFTGEKVIFLCGTVLLACALLWLFLLMKAFQGRLVFFASKMCNMLEDMMKGTAISEPLKDSETLFSKITSRLDRLYDMMKENHQKGEKERKEIQKMVSDISHQIKTPVSNLKMVAETLLEKPVSDREQREFLLGIKGQAEKLNFLFQALVKTSQMETGMIQIRKKPNLLYETIALSMSEIVYGAEKKGLHVTVNCEENLLLSHDRKWTAEALFNLLDNAVKYTPAGGSIKVSVEPQEMYVKISVLDTGKGIAEERHAAVFRRFYREQEVHDKPGVGIGLYLAREIISRQGGYIKLVSEERKGSEFSIYLPAF